MSGKLVGVQIPPSAPDSTMKEPKPNMTITGSGRRRARSIDLGHLLLLIFVLAIGFYAGSRYEEINVYLNDLNIIDTDTRSQEGIKPTADRDIELKKPISSTKEISQNTSEDRSTSDDAVKYVIGKEGKTFDTYTLQVVAFTKPKEAQQAVGIYRNKGYDAYTIEHENSRGEVWNLVRIGKFETRTKALLHARHFINSEGQEVLIDTYYLKVKN